MTQQTTTSELVGYLIYTRHGHSVSPNEQPSYDLPELQQEFWCTACATPLCKDPVAKYATPVHRVNIGIYSQVCDACGKLVVDGVKRLREVRVPLCLFGKANLASLQA